MDTPTIAKYYREKDPMERLKLLEQSIAAGEEPEENRIRKELWEIRYSDKAETGDTRADGYLGLWMSLTGIPLPDSLVQEVRRKR